MRRALIIGLAVVVGCAERPIGVPEDVGSDAQPIVATWAQVRADESRTGVIIQLGADGSFTESEQIVGTFRTEGSTLIRDYEDRGTGARIHAEFDFALLEEDTLLSMFPFLRSDGTTGDVGTWSRTRRVQFTDRAGMTTTTDERGQLDLRGDGTYNLSEMRGLVTSSGIGAFAWSGDRLTLGTGLSMQRYSSGVLVPLDEDDATRWRRVAAH